MSRQSQMTPVGKVSNQEDNLRTNDMGLMGKKTIIIAQPKVICTNLASGNAYSLRHLYLLFILKLYNDLICESLKSREQSKSE